MGLTPNNSRSLVRQLSANPMCRCFLLSDGDRYVGFSTCFFITSTFKVKPYLYVHDLYVEESL